MKGEKRKIVYKISALFISLFVLLGIISPDKLEATSKSLLDIISVNFGWLYLLVVAGIVCYCVYLAFSKYGNIKLGKEDDEPEFSNITWYAMLFSAGMGVGLMFYGIGEPISHFMSPAPGVAETTVDQARAALRYSFFHWGIHGWAVYAFVGLAMAYFMHRKQRKNLISESLRPLIGNRADGSLGKTIDIISIVAVTFGIAASLGVGVLQINTGMNYVFDVPQTNIVKMIIIAGLTCVYIASSYTGLDKGIKILSNVNLSVALVLLFFVLFAGPTTFILDTFTTTLGTYIEKFVSTSLNLSPFRESSWIGEWTLMYWAWWLSWSPFVGIFIARVSKGRTVKEFIISVVLLPSLFCFIWFSVFGGTGLHLQIYEGANIAQAVLADISSAIFATIELLPFGNLITPIILVLVITFFITSADSATFVLGMLSSDGDLNPPASKRIVWGILQALIAAVLIISGGIQSIQNVAVVFAFPFAFIIVAMCISMQRALKNDHKDLVKIHKDKESEIALKLKNIKLEIAVDKVEDKKEENSII